MNIHFIKNVLEMFILLLMTDITQDYEEKIW